MREKLSAKLLNIELSFETGQSWSSYMLSYILGVALWNWYVAFMVVMVVFMITAVVTPVIETLCHYAGWQMSEEKMYREDPGA